MDRSIVEGNEDMIVNFGAFSYEVEKMASILMVGAEVIAEQMKPGTVFRGLYDKGKNMRDYVLDLKLFEMAQSGDLKALDEFYARIE